ncbi:MAG: ImmA/IrrE family metallo-endopeptidase [Dehalococcoidia bacterium]
MPTRWSPPLSATSIAYPPAEVAERLKGARRRQGLTQQEIGTRLGVARTSVVSIESGQRSFDEPLIARLAEAYGVTVADLVGRRQTPVALVGQFRLPGSGAPRDQEHLDRAMAQLEEYAARYATIEELTQSHLRMDLLPRYDLGRDAPEAAGEAVAESERRRLGAGDRPILNLRQLLEYDFGLRVFSVDLPASVGAVFAASQAAGPCVAINRGHPAARQRWSMAHELAHFLTTPERADVFRAESYERLPAAERFAERFAAAFLMPRPGLERRLRGLASSGASVDLGSLILLAAEYGVSLEALALRLEDLGTVPPSTWDRLQTKGLRLREAAQALGVAPQPPDQETFPRRYLVLVVSAFENGDLTESQAASLLDMDRLTFRQLLDGAGESDALQTTAESPREVTIGA